MKSTSNNYQALVQKVMMYLDNELSKDAERELLIEMQTNPHFKEIMKKEKSFRDFIRSKVNRRRVSPALIENIKNKIRVTA